MMATQLSDHLRAAHNVLRHSSLIKPSEAPRVRLRTKRVGDQSSEEEDEDAKNLDEGDD